MLTDPRDAHELADRLDDILPPSRAYIYEPSDSDPALRAAVRIASDPRPVLSPAARHHIEQKMLAGTNGRRSVVARRRVWIVTGAAACLLVILLAALLVAAVSGEHPHRAPDADQAAPGELIYAPSSPDTSLVIPQDAIPLIEIEHGSTSIFIIPDTP